MRGSRDTRHELTVDPAGIRSSADRIDALAERLRSALTAVEKAGNPVPAGSDEVSERAAATLTRESDDLLTVLSETVRLLRADAAGLRGQAEVYEHADDEIAELFTRVRL